MKRKLSSVIVWRVSQTGVFFVAASFRRTVSLCGVRTLHHSPSCSRPRLAVLCECSRYSPASPGPSEKPSRSEKCLLRIWGGFFARSVQNTCIRIHDENHPRPKKITYCIRSAPNLLFLSSQRQTEPCAFPFAGSADAQFEGGCEAGWRLCLCISSSMEASHLHLWRRPSAVQQSAEAQSVAARCC